MKNINIVTKEKDVTSSKYVLDNFEELIKTPKYTFKEPEYDEDGQINMYWEFEEIQEEK